ncbi:MAG: hypothetical protein AB7D46_00780 [Flavobacteriaceae bacterium]
MNSILEKYLDKRDYTGSVEDEYCQFIITLYSHIGEELLPLINQAEELEAKIVLNPEFNDSDEYTLEMLTLEVPANH